MASIHAIVRSILCVYITALVGCTVTSSQGAAWPAGNKMKKVQKTSRKKKRGIRWRGGQTETGVQQHTGGRQRGASAPLVSCNGRNKIGVRGGGVPRGGHSQHKGDEKMHLGGCTGNGVHAGTGKGGPPTWHDGLDGQKQQATRQATWLDRGRGYATRQTRQQRK